MTFTRALRYIGGFVAFAFFASFLNTLPQHPAHAAGEVFTWKSYNQVTVSGGDLKGTSTLTLRANSASDNVAGVLVGDLLYNKGPAAGCTVSIELFIFKSDGNGSGEVWNPPPYDGQVVTAPGAPQPCYLVGEKDLDPAIHEKRVNIGGTRPDDPNDTTENPEDKQVLVGFYSSDPQSKAPKSDTVTIKQGDRVIATQTVPFVDDSGAANWPPDQTPVIADAKFTLEPGEYYVCDEVAIPKCEKFTKIKGQVFARNYGTPFVTPEKRMINVHVAYHTIRPCNASITVLPVTVTLKGPDGKLINKQTNSRTINPNPDEKKGDCDVDQVVGLDVTFENMPPGNYEASATGAPTVKFTKKPDEAANITLNVETTLQPPADQKVCTSGEGIAGAFALFVCPFTEVIAKSTNFFEKNIIIPFMTVSPLTTNADNPIYILWQNFRNLANIGFIIFFFFIIFSQATSIGISNYGIKRMLSRIFVVAIALNLSYFIAAFVIDAFNVFGGGLSALITAIIQKAGTTQLNNGTEASPLGSIFVLGGTALAVAILSGGAVLGWLFSLISLAALIIVVVVMVLLLRQIAIIMLVILAPIAILLYMLPNTENYFQKWRKTLIQLLLMYPMIVLLFASGKLFGMILQQPGLIQTGGAISDEAAEALRVILQFIVYALPLALLPLTFAASGTLMSRAYGWANNRLLRPRSQRMKEDASLMRSEARARMAGSKVPGLNTIAGSKYRRDYNREARKRSVTEAQEEILAHHLGGQGIGSKITLRNAAGVAGQAGRTRAAASAARTFEKSMAENLKNESALLTQEMRKLGMDEDTFAGHVANYLQNPNDQANRVITGSNGQTFDFAANETRLQHAYLNSAASQGHVGAIEAARTNTDMNQNIVDDVIRRNDGTLKGKGGYHLATDFTLAAGRMQVHDPATGDLRAPANRHEMDAEMKAQRLIAMSQTGLNSIAGMKTGLIMDSASTLSTPGQMRDDVLRIMDHASAAETAKRRRDAPTAPAVDYRAMLRNKADQLLEPRMQNTLARSDNDRSDFEALRDNL